MTRTFPDREPLADSRITGGIAYYPDGASVRTIDDPVRWFMGYKDTEVNVQCKATAVITLQIDGDGRPQTRANYKLLPTMENMITEVSNLLERLKPFAQSN